MTRLRTWSQNPLLKACVQNVTDTPCLYHHAMWQVREAVVGKTPALMVVWPATEQRGALVGEAVTALCEVLEEYITTGRYAYCVLVMTSAGADVHAPFESLVGIKQWVEAMHGFKQQHALRVEGVVTGPLGTYGGASLLLATVCDDAWCESLEEVHLLS